MKISTESSCNSTIKEEKTSGKILSSKKSVKAEKSPHPSNLLLIIISPCAISIDMEKPSFFRKTPTGRFYIFTNYNRTPSMKLATSFISPSPLPLLNSSCQPSYKKNKSSSLPTTLT